MNTPPLVDKKTLELLYIQKGMAMNKIAKALGISVGSVYNYMRRFRIQSRNELTPEQKRAMGMANVGNKYCLGKTRSRETRVKISEARKGSFKKSSLYGAHTKKRRDGYIYVYCPNHPFCSAEGYVMEHRLAMERKIGRYLEDYEVVHHKNGNRADNRLENLELMTKKDHARYHMIERYKTKGVMTYQ